MMEIKTRTRESAREDDINTIMMTPEQKRIQLLETQLREMKRAITILQNRINQTDKKSSVAYNNSHTNKIQIHQIKEQLNQG